MDDHYIPGQSMSDKKTGFLWRSQSALVVVAAGATLSLNNFITFPSAGKSRYAEIILFSFTRYTRVTCGQNCTVEFAFGVLGDVVVDVVHEHTAVVVRL